MYRSCFRLSSFSVIEPRLFSGPFFPLPSPRPLSLNLVTSLAFINRLGNDGAGGGSFTPHLIVTAALTSSLAGVHLSSKMAALGPIRHQRDPLPPSHTRRWETDTHAGRGSLGSRGRGVNTRVKKIDLEFDYGR